MGVTISNKEYGIDLTYSGFAKSRIQVAENISHAFRNWYEKFLDLNYKATAEDDRLCAHYQNLYGISDEVLGFLFGSDCDGKISAKTAKEIWKLIKDDNENFCIGYVGRPDRAMYQDFREIIEQAAKHRWVVKWY